MPSGAKKRKAAKKKKEQASSTNSTTTNNNNNNRLGNGDPKSQDERESDGGDSGSPASQDHHNQQHPFDKGNEESEMGDPKSMEEVSRDIKGTAKVGSEDNGAVKNQRELESKDDLGGQNISIEHVEFQKESHDGSSSSSSSSDNESQAVEKVSIGKTDDPVAETAPAVDSVKPLVNVAKEVINVAESNSYKNSMAPTLIESRSKENEELKRNEDKVIPLYGESVEVSWTVVEPVTNENEGTSLPLAAPDSSNGAELRNSKSTQSSENQPLLAPAPRVEQRTSWLSCCGLFDVITGSGR
ncbi:hypothetical protein ACOSP7_011665 [Xanthoceras sorbifolium]